MSSKDVKPWFLKSVTTPPGLTLSQSFGFYIGNLIATWGITESVIRGIYTCLVGNDTPSHAEITWLTIKNTRSRLELVQRSATASPIPKHFKDEIARIVAEFNGVTKVRNLYSHALYEANPETGELVSIAGFDLTHNDEIFVATVKKADKATLNEIRSAIHKCNDLNREAAGFLIHLRDEMQAHFLELPAWPDGYPNNPRFPLPKRGKS